MKILFTHSVSDLYGASRSLLRLTSNLVEDGHEILVVLNEDGPLVNELEKKSITVQIRHFTTLHRHNLNFVNLIKLLFLIPIHCFNFSKIVINFKPNIIHSNTALIITPAIIAKFFNICHVWHVREFFYEYGKLWFYYQRFMYHFSDKIICVSKSVVKQFSIRDRKKCLISIYNGFPKEEFENINEKFVSGFKQKYNLNNYILIGLVGRIKIGRKGQDTFIKAASLINIPINIKYLIIGSPFYAFEDHVKKLKQMVTEYGLENKVIFTGEVLDSKIAIKALDISILASGLPEPFGGVVIESMALEKPVIGTNIGGTIEQIENKISGLLVEPNDAEELAKAISILIDEDKRKKMGFAAKNRYLKLFEFNIFYKKINKLYYEILNSKKG